MRCQANAMCSLIIALIMILNYIYHYKGVLCHNPSFCSTFITKKDQPSFCSRLISLVLDHPVPDEAGSQINFIILGLSDSQAADHYSVCARPLPSSAGELEGNKA